MKKKLDKGLLVTLRFAVIISATTAGMSVHPKFVSQLNDQGYSQILSDRFMRF
jgi:hypothetical protein